MRFDTVRAVAGQELRFLLRQGGPRWAALALCVALVAALALGWQHRASVQSAQAALQAQVEREWRAQPDRHPHRVAHFGTYAFRLPAPLGLFDRGADTFAGNAIYLEAHRQNPANFAGARHATVLLRFGELTPALLLQTLVPLFLMLLAAVSVPRERERGTLALLQANGADLRALAAGKALAYAGLGSAVVAATFALTLLVAALGAPAPAAADVANAALLAVGYALLMAACALGAVLLGAGLRSARAAALLAAGLWLAMFVVAPRVAPYWAETAHPAATRLALEAAVHAELRGGGDGHDAADPGFAAFRRSVLARYGVERTEDLPVNIRGLVMAEGERRGAESYARHHAARAVQLERQDQMLRTIGIAVPVLALRALSASLCGTDRHAFAAFEARAEAHRYTAIQKLNDLHAREIREHRDRDQRVGRHHWETFEPFRDTRRPARITDAGPAAAFATLLGWAAGLAVLLAVTRARSLA